MGVVCGCGCGVCGCVGVVCVGVGVVWVWCISMSPYCMLDGVRQGRRDI